MSGYGEFVWSAFGFAFLVLAVNVVTALRRLRKSREKVTSSDQQ